MTEETPKKVCGNPEESAALVTCWHYAEGAMNRRLYIQLFIQIFLIEIKTVSYFCSVMQYLILAILCSTCVFIAMRLFDRFGIDNHRAIAANYAAATVAGLLMCKGIDTPTEIITEPWFGLSILTGFWFILTYLLMTYSSQHAGVTITSLSSKLSVVIPTTLGVILFHEKLNLPSIIGIVLAIAALCMIVGGKSESGKKSIGWLVILSIAIFLGTGTGDMLMKFTEQLNKADDMTFMITFIYFIALLFGLAIVLFDRIKGKSKFQWKNLVGGIGLGLVNFFSSYCMYHCMRIFDNVFLFPIYNIGVVCATAITGRLLFKEKLSAKNYIGLALAIIAVILITLKP